MKRYYLCIVTLMTIIGQTDALTTVSQAMLSDSQMFRCHNGGTPFQEGLTQKCRCPKDYEGQHCETVVAHKPRNERKCDHPCFNGGKCYFENHTMLCKCEENFFGVHCETRGTEKGTTANERPEPWPEKEHENATLIMKSRNDSNSHSTSTDYPVLEGGTVQTNTTNRTSINGGQVWRFSHKATLTTVILISILGPVVFIGAVVFYRYRRRNTNTPRYNEVNLEDEQPSHPV